MAQNGKLTAFALNCSLKSTSDDEKSSTDKLIGDLFSALEPHGVSGSFERAADYDIKPGVLSDETDEAGRMPPAGKVALVAVVGNEDGAHHCHAAMFQALNDVGFTIPANAGLYWVGEAMGDVNYVDLKSIPDTVRTTLDTAAANAAHLARLLRRETYPGG